MLLNWNFNNSYLSLPQIFYSYVKPDKIENSEIILLNEKLIDQLDIDYKSLSKNELSNELLGQNKKNINNFFSQAYAGHQFGQFTILGDGRALILGEHINKNNDRFDIQLKGSGLTPYSRSGDGKATLSSMIREYIVSESMHYMCVPTTRSLAVIETKENILREKYEKGGILVRVAKSHIRVGTFEFARILKQDRENVKYLINYTIERLYPELIDNKNKYISFFEIIAKKQIDLVVNWMRVGFIHGVMNTDNMSLSGETIDYGPCAFLDEYNPKKVFSSIDKLGRYSFENQPKIVLWNLARFAETFLFLIDNDQNKAVKIIEKILKEKNKYFENKWLNMMRDKLFLVEEDKDDISLISELLNLMNFYKLDYTNTFIHLQNDDYSKLKKIDSWVDKYKTRKTKKNKIELNKINCINPYLIPRNHLVENCLKESEKGNYNNLFKLMDYLTEPYKNNNIEEKYCKPPEDHEKVHQTFCGT